MQYLIGKSFMHLMQKLIGSQTELIMKMETLNLKSWTTLSWDGE